MSPSLPKSDVSSVSSPPSKLAYLGASLLVHLAFALPVARLRSQAPPAPSVRNQIVVELVGIVSNRQVAAPRAETARPIVPVAEPQKTHLARTSRRTRPMRSTTTGVEWPTPVPEPIAETVARETAAGGSRDVQADSPDEATKPRGDAASNGTGAGQNQLQRTIARVDNPDPQAQRKYLALVWKSIQARLVYPAQAREAGYVGTPVIRLTITVDGSILPGSLAIARSSGYPLLDENALKAAHDSAPLPPPPRQMTVTIAVAFVREP